MKGDSMSKTKAVVGELVESNGDIDELVKLEREINEGLSRFYEDEYYVAARLLYLREHEMWRAVSESWQQYADSGRIHVGRSQANRKIQYGKARANLADLAPNGANQWSESNCRPLYCLDPKDAKRISGKIRTHLKNNPDEKLTANLVKSFVMRDSNPAGDDDPQELPSQQPTLVDYLRECTREVKAMRRRLKEVPEGAWDTVESEFPNLISRMVGELNGLAAYLRGE